MIDFRYHLVSLASVLIALAIGIVLGAGPLKEGISESLNSQVVQLRKEKTDLRTDLDDAQKSLSVHSDFETGALRHVIAARLTGARTLIVTLPDAPVGVVSRTEDSLVAAGAVESGRVTLTSKWADPDEAVAAEREALAGELSAGLSLPENGQTGGQLLDRVLAAVLVGPIDLENTPTTPTPEERQAIWDRLEGADLVSGALPESLATSDVVLASPAVTTPTAADESVSARLAGVSAELDARCAGAVLVGQLPAAGDDASSAVSAARGQSSIRRHLSTVDNSGDPMGQASVVLALAEQLVGGSGQYGLLPNASAAFPSGL